MENFIFCAVLKLILITLNNWLYYIVKLPFLPEKKNKIDDKQEKLIFNLSEKKNMVYSQENWNGHQLKLEKIH